MNHTERSVALSEKFDLSVFRQLGHTENELFSFFDGSIGRRKHSSDLVKKRHPESWANQQRIDYLDKMFDYPNDVGDLLVWNDVFTTELAQRFIEKRGIDRPERAAYGLIDQIKDEDGWVTGYSVEIYQAKKDRESPWFTLTIDVNGVCQQVEEEGSSKRVSKYDLPKTMWALEWLKVDLDLAGKKKMSNPLINKVQGEIGKQLSGVSDFQDQVHLRKALGDCKKMFDQAQQDVCGLTSELMPKNGDLKRRARERKTNLLWLNTIEKNRRTMVSLSRAVNGKLVGLDQLVFEGWHQVLGSEFIGFTTSVFYRNIFDLFPHTTHRNEASLKLILENRLPGILEAWQQAEGALGEKKPEIRSQLAKLFTDFMDFHKECLDNEVAAQAKGLLDSFIAS